MLHRNEQLREWSCWTLEGNQAPHDAGLKHPLRLGRPDDTPAIRVDEFAREYLTGTPCVAIRSLNERAVRTSLVFGWISA